MMKSISCPNCNTPNSLTGVENRSFRCSKCTALVHTTPDPKLIDKKGKKVTPLAYLKLGDKAKIYGAEIEVKGRISYVEHDDGKNYYWEDWFATDKAGNEYWLDIDPYSKQFTFFKRIEHNESEFLKNHKLLPPNGDKPDIVEKGYAKVIDLAGEMPFLVKPGDKIGFIDAVGGKGLYSVEWDETTARLYLGQSIDPANFYEAFGNNAMAEKIRHERRVRIKWGKIDPLVFVIMLFSMMGLAVALLVGSPIAKGTVEVCPAQPGCSAEAEVGPFYLTQFPGLYKLTITSDLPSPAYGSETWKSVTAEIENAEGEVTNGYYLDIWSEYWVEGGESGVESQRTENVVFRADESGEHNLVFSIETSPDNKATRHAITYTFERVYLQSQHMLGLLVVSAIYFGIRTGLFGKILREA